MLDHQSLFTVAGLGPSRTLLASGTVLGVGVGVFVLGFFLYVMAY